MDNILRAKKLLGVISNKQFVTRRAADFSLSRSADCCSIQRTPASFVSGETRYE